MKIEITGCVIGGKGPVTGIVDIEDTEALRLINLMVAKEVLVPVESAPSDSKGTTSCAPLAPVSPAPTLNKKKAKA